MAANANAAPSIMGYSAINPLVVNTGGHAHSGSGGVNSMSDQPLLPQYNNDLMTNTIPASPYEVTYGSSSLTNATGSQPSNALPGGNLLNTLTAQSGTDEYSEQQQQYLKQRHPATGYSVS